MAVVTIGGVLLSAVYALFLIPVIYTKLDRFSVAARDYEGEARERARAEGRGYGGEPLAVAGD